MSNQCFSNTQLFTRKCYVLRCPSIDDITNMKCFAEASVNRFGALATVVPVLQGTTY